jgi:hypothetical protein
MQIFLKDIHGESFSLQVDELDTISTVKNAIENQYHYPVDKQKLYFRGRRLNDDSPVNACKIRKGSTLLLLIKGGCPDESYANLKPCKSSNCIFFGQERFSGLCSKCYIMEQIAEKGLKIPEVSLDVLLPITWQKGELSNIPSIVPSFSIPSVPPASPSTTEDELCHECNRRIPLISYTCRCMHKYCAHHRYSDRHNCPFSYKELGRRELEKANPRIVAPKIHKL